MRDSICLSILAAGILLALQPGPAHAEGDAAKGKTKFARCGACHSIDGKTRAGPTLKGVFGRTSGTLEGYNYSPALVQAKVIWSEETLETYLAGPAKMIRGTKMTISMPKPDDRADVIAYLKTLSAE